MSKQNRRISRSRRFALAALPIAAGLTLGLGATSQAQAGNGYTAKSCAVSPDGKARLSVTRWIVGSKWRYHMDLNSTTYPVAYYQNRITFDGAKLSGTNDVYKDVTGTGHTVVGYWIMANGYSVHCTVKS